MTINSMFHSKNISIARCFVTFSFLPDDESFKHPYQVSAQFEVLTQSGKVWNLVSVFSRTDPPPVVLCSSFSASSFTPPCPTFFIPSFISCSPPSVLNSLYPSFLAFPYLFPFSFLLLSFPFLSFSPHSPRLFFVPLSSFHPSFFPPSCPNKYLYENVQKPWPQIL
ncbi:hypothetical protein ATANTOWER_016660 [Ataeniobius toweri]|uniref:Uncharacterized protein n=1 Tax=Ataeniobius toweri TaxID=208326 RepID=A0ABU7AGF8_9TELE|nr:hypothetical protein [Ataeniobius toweri]